MEFKIGAAEPAREPVVVESRISRDARESRGMEILNEIYPEAQLAQVTYKYGWDYDRPNNGFDPATKKIIITLDVDYVEEEMAACSI